MKFDVADFNPAKKLSAESLKALRELTPDQVKELAKEYPNQPRGNAYLTLYDKNVAEDKQIFSLSTFQNLAKLHSLGKTNYTPWNFRSGGRVVVNQLKGGAPSKVVKGKKVVDLSAEDIATAEGLKKADEVVEAPATVSETAPAADAPVNDAPAADATEDLAMKAYLDAKAEYDKAVEKKAHPNTVRSLEAKMKAAAEAAGL